MNDSGLPSYPAYPLPGADGLRETGAAPRLLRAVVVLLMINLGLSIVLTVVTVAARHTIGLPA